MKIKGFDENLCCRGMQFEIGKTYDTGAKDDEIELCSNTVFHYCDSIRKVHAFYSCNPIKKNRFCEIEVLGSEVSDNKKCGSNKIRLVREIEGEELKILLGMVDGNSGLFNSGNENSGNYNSGDYNSGHRNSGSYNSGSYNSGYWNSGDRNSGDWNSGDWNSGDWNSGDFNSCDNSNGVFCNKEDNNIRIFNRPSGMSLLEFKNSKYHEALVSAPIELTFWDKSENRLKTRTYKEACAIWWEKLTEKNKEIIKQIPNFDPDIFFDITGIDLRGVKKC